MAVMWDLRFYSGHCECYYLLESDMLFVADIPTWRLRFCALLPYGVFFCNYVKNVVHEFKQQITEISEAVTLEML